MVVGKCGGVIRWIAKRARGFRVNVLRGCSHVEVNGGMHCVCVGVQVRRQATTTLRAIEALVRFQARVRGHQVRMSKEGQAVQSKILRRRQLNSRTSKPGVCLIFIPET